MVSRYLKGAAIDPSPIKAGVTVADLMDSAFGAYNAARLREAGQLLTQKCLNEDVTIGMTLTGALTPAGMSMSTLIPLVEAGFVDWIVSTGANLYHDAHFGLGLSLHAGTHHIDDVELRKEGVVRIYDIFMDYTVLLETDAYFRKIFEAPEFQRTMGSAEFHYLCGKYLRARERKLGRKKRSLLTACYEFGVPVYTSSPGDSSIGMNVAASQLAGSSMGLDPIVDVNETAAIVYDAKHGGGKSAVWIVGGGSPKNFALQTEPHIQEVLGLNEKGHDFFIQITDARPDTGGLSGATPSEAVSWGKIDPKGLPNTVVCYCDSTIAMPMLAAYALSRHKPRKHKRLYDRRAELVRKLRSAYLRRKGK